MGLFDIDDPDAALGYRNIRSATFSASRTISFVHNLAAARPIRRKWMNWVEEFQPTADGKQLRRLKHRK
jgi:hypothetical protein